jgi:serine/threonine-protein kinase
MTGTSQQALNPTATQLRAPVTFDESYSDTMAQRLTVFIGPIAKVVVKRAMRQTNDKAAFLDLLAEHIEVAAERSRFLSEAKHV